MFGWIRRLRQRRVSRLKAEVEAYGEQIRDWARRQEMPEVDIRPHRPYVRPADSRSDPVPVMVYGAGDSENHHGHSDSGYSGSSDSGSSGGGGDSGGGGGGD